MFTPVKGRSVLVTGSSKGIGRGIAGVFARAGARVLVVARTLSDAQEAADEFTGAGGTASAFSADVNDLASMSAAADAAAERHGGLDVVCANAGIFPQSRIEDMDPGEWDDVLGTNLRGPFVLSCEVARRLIAAELPGRMVNISSVGAFHYGGNGAALYSITKAGINRMTEALAVEWARFGINVNAIAPGAFSSEMMDGMLQRVGDITQHFPRKRLGDPAQLDSTLLYLVAPSSEFVTGTVIKVDDGQGPR